MFFALPNLVSTEAAPCVPWEFTRLDLVPPKAFSDKSARTVWLQKPETVFQCYSAFEGVNAGLRLKGPSAADEGNPPASMAALCADYDLRLSEAEIEAGLARMPIKPNHIETTLSGNARLVWLFERPIALPSYSFAIFLLQKISELIPVKQLAGLDEPALLSPDRYYTNGCKWRSLPTPPVPADLLNGFLIQISPKFGWDAPEFGPTIPLDVAAAELRKKFPNFNWPGAFELGSSGPSFFVSGSQSPLSAIVRASGLQTFSAHASKPFFTWQELLGAEFVRQFKTKQLGSAVENIFFDEKTYFSKLANGNWACDSKDNLALYLKTHKGLSDRVRKGENSSEIENAIAYVHRNQRVKTAASFAFYPEGLNIFNGEPYLNLHTRKALVPAPCPCEWGVGFPWIAKFLENLFDPPAQLPFFLSWLSHFYTSCHARSPRSGHALFIAGGTNVGKTFLSRGLISGLVSGFGECNQFLMGSDSFNAELFDYALWAVDDGSMAADFKSQKRFSEMVKRCVANPSFRLNGKFLKAATVRWQGRVVVTMNLDAESLRLMPDLELSLREKVMLLKTVAVSKTTFLAQPQMEDILTRELPCLARYLVDYEFPEHTLGKDPRFFVAPYHEESLVSNANQSSASGAFSEILSEFLTEYFAREQDKDHWQGTALQLHKQIMSDPTMAVPMHRYDSMAIGRQLSTLCNKNTFEISVASVDSHRIFTIRRGNRYLKKPNGHRVVQAEGSRFEKL